MTTTGSYNDIYTVIIYLVKKHLHKQNSWIILYFMHQKKPIWEKVMWSEVCVCVCTVKDRGQCVSAVKRFPLSFHKSGFVCV